MGLIVFIGEVLLLMIWMSPSIALSQSPTDAHCALSQTCGPLKVRYPFKLQSEPNCPSFSPFFDLECKGEDLFLHNFTFNGTDWPLKVLHIQSDSLIVDATDLKAVMGINSTNGTCSISGLTNLTLPVFPGPFGFADDNSFGSFGCTLGLLVGAGLVQNKSTSATGASLSNVEVGGCSVLCPDNERNPECNGGTCCVSGLARGTFFRELVYGVERSPFNTNAEQLVPCNNNYAIIFDADYTDFSNYGLKVKWALPSNQTSSIVDKQKSIELACSDHSIVTIVQEVPGYRCSCQQGFNGDGYLHGLGCSGYKWESLRKLHKPYVDNLHDGHLLKRS